MKFEFPLVRIMIYLDSLILLNVFGIQAGQFGTTKKPSLLPRHSVVDEKIAPPFLFCHKHSACYITTAIHRTPMFALLHERENIFLTRIHHAYSKVWIISDSEPEVFGV